MGGFQLKYFGKEGQNYLPLYVYYVLDLFFVVLQVWTPLGSTLNTSRFAIDTSMNSSKI